MAAGKALRWGVLSTSSIAQAQVIPAIMATPGCSVAAIASRDPRRGKAVARRFDIPEVFPDYQSLLDGARIDVLYIPLPNALHETWAIKAAERGIAVLCEKPLSTDAASARRIVEAFERASTPLMEAFMYRFHPLHARVRSLIADGAIGALREVRAHLSTFQTETRKPDNIVLSAELGGGVLLDAGCYPVNVCRMLFGAEPRRAFAMQEVDSRFGVDVTTAAILQFDDGRLGLISTSHRAGGISFYTAIGTHGTIEVPRGFLPGWGDVIDEPLLIVTDGRTTARREEIVHAPNQYGSMVATFAEAVALGRAVPYPARDAIANLATIDAIVASARSGRVERVSPA